MPDPDGGGGAVHEFELVSHLASDHEISVVSCGPGSNADRAGLEAAGIRVRHVDPGPNRPPTSKLSIAWGLVASPGTMAMWASRHRIPAVRSALAEEVVRHRPDLVQITQGDLAAVADAVPERVPQALLLFDSLSRVQRTRAQTENLLRRRLRYRIEAGRSARFERRSYARFDGLAAVSSVDARFVGSMLGREVDVLENPVPEKFFAPPLVSRDPATVLFVGALGHRPNQDAIEWLATEVWPSVRAARPEVRLRVAGRAGGDDALVSRLRRFVEPAGGTVVPDVEDIRTEYWRATVTVAPIRYGAGLRNKVIHAMACGSPVVATSRALEGVPADAAAVATTADDATGLARAVVATLDDRPDPAVAVAAVAPLRTSAVVERHAAWWAATVARD